MVEKLDNDAINQITTNVHEEKSQIYLPCLKTYGDVLGKRNEFSDSAEAFFEYLASHKSRGTELRQRKDPVRAFRTSPITDCLLDIANEEWEKNKSLNISKAVELAFSSVDPSIFDSVMSSQLSVFEKAVILKEECGNLADITIISNDQNIKVAKQAAEKEVGGEFTETDFSIMNTNEWLEKQLFDGGDADITNIVLSILRERGELKVGSRVLRLQN